MFVFKIKLHISDLFPGKRYIIIKDSPHHFNIIQGLLTPIQRYRVTVLKVGYKFETTVKQELKVQLMQHTEPFSRD